MAEAQSHVIDDIAMRWFEEGEGPAVVFVHGIPTGPELWRHVIPRLAGTRRLAWEMVGYAGSIPEGASRDISVARQSRLRTAGTLAAAGVGYGAALYLVNFKVLSPTLFTTFEMANQPFELVVHVVFGTLLALAFLLVPAKAEPLSVDRAARPARAGASA